METMVVMADISGETIHCGAVSISLKNQMFTNQESIFMYKLKEL